jgi:glycosyltransferase involved in cell wall biosynthesis
MEAMLRGVPVLSSDAGGLVEAKAGTGFVIPVRPIETFENTFDETLMPRPVVPPQDIEPWTAALHTLLKDKAAYWAESERSREAALRFVAGLRASDFADFLHGLSHGQPPAAVPQESSPLDRLSPEKRALLLRRLRGRN